MALKKDFRLSVSALALVLFSGASADAHWAHQGERQVIFKAVGPGGLALEGKGGDISLTEQGSSIVASVGLGDITTGIGLRDKHMREKYLEVAKYPRAVFTFEKSKVRSPGEGDIDGQLLLHGVTKPIRVHYKAVGTEKEATINGSARLNMKHFDIAVPSYLGVTVKPEVTVTFKLSAVDK